MTAPHQNLVGMSGAVDTGEETDPNFNQTVLLLHGDGTNGGQNNTFVDSSSSGHTITRSGTPTQGTFNPFLGEGQYSVYGDSADTDYVQYPIASLQALGSGVYTIEFWVYLTIPTTSSNWRPFFGASNGAGANPKFNLHDAGSNQLTLEDNGGTLFSTGSVRSQYTNQWCHIAVVREGLGTNQTHIYVNGSKEGTGTHDKDLASITSGGFRIGRNPEDHQQSLDGYISNFKMTAAVLYSGSSFTISTNPLTLTSQGSSSSNVKLLTHQSNRFLDNSSTGYAPTIVNTPKVVPFSPFAPTASYSESVHGGSMSFNVPNIHDQYLTISDDGSFNPGSGEFEISLWIYPTSFEAHPGGPNYFSRGVGGSTSTDFISIQGYNTASSSTQVDFYGGGNLVTSTNSIFLNQWNYIRARKTSSQKSLYVNGVETTNATVAAVTAGISPFVSIGAQTYGVTTDGRQGHGHISNVRYIVGSVGTESGIPAAPLTSTGTDTELLLNFTNAEIIDNTMKGNLGTEDDAQIDTSVKKFGTGSMQFDGTGDFLKEDTNNPLYNFGTGNFTIEFFVYATSSGGNIMIIGSNADYPYVNLQLATKIQLVVKDPAGSGVGVDFSLGGDIQNAWRHIAVVRQNQTTAECFLDGTSKGTKTLTASHFVDFQSAGLRVASWKSGALPFQGYLDEVRVSRVSRYSSNFSIPTTAYPNK